MKLKLSVTTLKRLLTSVTIFNFLILITFIFLLLSTSVFENTTIFILSLPAYILSKSWLLIVSLFGFEICLIVYYWIKTRNTIPSKTFNQFENIYDIELSNNNNLNTNEEQFNINGDSIITDENEIREEKIEPNTVVENPIAENFTYEQDNNIDERENEEIIQAEMDFDKLWEEAIEHVKKAVDKKKVGELTDVINEEYSEKVEMNDNQTDLKITDFSDSVESVMSNNLKDNKISRALIEKTSIKPKLNFGNPSIIKEHHKDFYNEIALNNWIYQKASDRERAGIYKLALDETKYKETDFKYLIDYNIIYKILVPFSSGAFTIYTIYEAEDKKIISNYLAKLCKRNNLNYTHKSFSINNYSECGLDRKSWQFDFCLNNNIIGLIWISNFLIKDDNSEIHSIGYKNKKELRALLVITQMINESTNYKAMIITDYNFNIEIIKNYIGDMSSGQISFLAFGEENFEKSFLREVTKLIPIKREKE